MSSAFNWTIKKLNKTKQHVSFASHNTLWLYKEHDKPLVITYDSGSKGNYLSKKDLVKAGLLILRPSTHMVGVANGGTSQAQHITQLPFHKLSARARQADTFHNFPTSLMSVGTTSNEGTISVFTKTGDTVFKEEDVLITYKGKPILIGVRDKRGTIPKTADAAAMTLATETTIQTSTTGTTTGQQCIRPPIKQTSHQMDARRMWIPGKIDLDQSHKSRQLREVANAN